MNVLALIVLLPLLAGTTLCFAAGRVDTLARRRLTAWAAAAVAGAAFALLLWLAPGVFAGEVLLRQAEWVPATATALRMGQVASGWNCRRAAPP